MDSTSQQGTRFGSRDFKSVFFLFVVLCLSVSDVVFCYFVRTAVEREEKKALIAAGINVTDRIFTAEEVSLEVRG